MSLTSIADHSDRTTASNLAFEALLSLLYSPLEIKVQIHVHDISSGLCSDL